MTPENPRAAPTPLQPGGAWHPRRILIADPTEELEALLREARPDVELRRLPPEKVGIGDLDWAQVYLGFRRPPVAGWGAVRWIHSTGAGVDRFLFRADLPTGILLTRSSEDFGPVIGEYCLARALAATQRLSELAEYQARRTWASARPASLAGSRAVVVGTGLVGRGIARAFSRCDGVVDGVSRSGTPKAPFRQVVSWEGFTECVAGAQWLILAAPLTEATWHLLDRDILRSCHGVHLINVARGALIAEEVLVEALDRGWLCGASLDVFETEPLPPESPLWHHPKVRISPHCSGLTRPAAALEGFLECLSALEAGEAPPWQVDRGRGY